MHCPEPADFDADLEDAVIDLAAGLTVTGGEVFATVARRSAEEKTWAYASDPAAGVQIAEPSRVRLLPYREWDSRGAGTMRVFVPAV